jgi:uncharacterized protein (TIGR00251 family)
MTGEKAANQVGLKETDSGVLINIRATPGAARDKILGIHANTLKIAVCAPAIDGKANKALCRVLAKKLGIKRSSVSLHSGKTSRNKCFLLAGIGKAEAAGIVAEALPAEKRPR